MKREIPSIIHLAPAKHAAPTVKPREFDEVGVQGALFPSKRSNILIFVELDQLNEPQFFSLLQELSPKIIIDVRIAPRFDIGRCNRQRAFHAFSEINAAYLEVPGLLDMHNVEKSNSGMRRLVDMARKNKMIHDDGLVGPILFFIGNLRAEARYLRLLPQLLPLPKGKQWEVLSIP